MFGIAPKPLEAIAPEYLGAGRDPQPLRRVPRPRRALNACIAMAAITLREITADSVCAVCRLAVRPDQQGLVAPNAVSIAQATFEPAAWFRAVYADDEPVGFAMLYDPRRASAPRDPDVAFLWRFMIDARYQRRGYGAAALDLVIAQARTIPGVTRMRVSYVDMPRNPAPLYERAGFARTGEIDDGEIVMELPFRGD